MNKLLLLGLSLFLVVTQTLAGDGHDHGAMPGQPAGNEGNWIHLSRAGEHNIGLELAEVRPGSIHEVLPAVGLVEAAPGQRIEVNSRIAGQVEELLVSEGEQVKKGQLLLSLRSALPGDPPPLIKLYAAISGTVTRLHVTSGSRVTPDEHLLDVVDLRVVDIRARVHEGQIRYLRQGQEARIRALAWPDSLWSGTLTRIGGELDPETGTLPAWFRVTSPKGSLKPKMRCELSIIKSETARGLLIPRRALLEDQALQRVFVLRDAKEGFYEEVEVMTGIKDDQHVLVLEGLLMGDFVVAAGNHSMRSMPRSVSRAELLSTLGEHDGHDHGQAQEDPHDLHDHMDELATGSAASQKSINWTLGLLLALSLLINGLLLWKRDNVREGGAS
jgi:multidrug efflux pump subunit AcrA (membrane-fusion protein)